MFLAEKKYQMRKKTGINFHELKTTIFRENKLSRILENRIFRGIKLSRICQNSQKSRKFLPHYFLPLKYKKVATIFITLKMFTFKQNKTKLKMALRLLMSKEVYELFIWSAISKDK